MTPEELVKQLRYPTGWSSKIGRDAADMIERLLAQLANERAILAAVDELGRGMSIGLSRATRECDALRAELADYRNLLAPRLDEANAAIARVRELCDEPFYTGSPKYWLAVSDVRAALEVSDVR